MKKQMLTTRLLIIFLMLSMILPALTGCSSSQAEEKLANMTLEEKVGQMIMPAFRLWSDDTSDQNNAENLTVLNTASDQSKAEKVTELNDALRTAIADLNLGGVVLFSENCSDTAQTLTLTNDMQQAAAVSSTGLPLLIAADQEGGTVYRLQTGTAMTGNMAIAATGDAGNAKETGEIIGSELSALGINVDFAPDCDVNSNPQNPVIGVRSFSDDPDIVSKYAKAYIKGLHRENVASCIKHFPGHGDTSTDSHTGLPSVDKTKAELNQSDFIPFASLSDETDMVMTAHIQYPEIESQTYISKSTNEAVYLPATMSKTIISDILRDEMGFDGVVTTDSLIMDAIAKHFSSKDVAKMVIQADVDILLMPVTVKDTASLQELYTYVNDIVAMVKSGEIPEEEIDNSVLRILKLKEKYCESSGESLEQRIETAQTIVGCEEHHQKEWEMALEAITEYKNEDLLPIELIENQTVLCLCPRESQLESAESVFEKMKREGIIPESTILQAVKYLDESESSLENMITNADIVIVESETRSVKDFEQRSPVVNKIIELTHNQNKKVLLISNQLPYDAPVYAEAGADAVLLAYNLSGGTIPEEFNGDVEAYGPNVAAAIYTAFGGSKAAGKCPVNLTTK